MNWLGTAAQPKTRQVLYSEVRMPLLSVGVGKELVYIVISGTAEGHLEKHLAGEEWRDFKWKNRRVYF